MRESGMSSHQRITARAGHALIGCLVAALAACAAPAAGPATSPAASAAPASSATPGRSDRLVPIAVGDELGSIEYGFGAAWVNRTRIPQGDEIVKIDAASGNIAKVQEGVRVAVGDDALWVVDYERIRKVDPDTGKTTFSVPAPGATSVSVGAGAVWATIDAGVGRLDPRTRSLKIIPLDSPPSYVRATDDAVWVNDKNVGAILRIDPSTNKVVAKLETGTTPHGIDIDATGVWITDHQTNSVLRIDPATNKIAATISGTGNGVGITACGGAIWSSTEGEGVFRIDPATNEAQLEIAVPGEFIYGLACGDDELWLSSWYAEQVYRYPL